MNWQDVFIGLIVLSAFALTLARLFRFFKSPASKCEGCSGCKLEELKKSVTRDA